MRAKFLLISVILIIALQSVCGCFCRNNAMCNCGPRARLRLNKPRNIVAVIQPLPQNQVINPNICRCGCGQPLMPPLPALPTINPILPDTPDLVQDLDQTAFGARCLCSKQSDDLDRFAPDNLPPIAPQLLTPEILSPETLPPGTPYWTVNAAGNLQFIPANAPMQNLPDYLENPIEAVEEKIEEKQNFLRYINGILLSKADNILSPLFYNK
ncbi:uncharacterized protein LOC129802769 [Phlebotomus papatasi]|uniref:uncharacterized protein LOC129802769 n=1 Tax=Phlebotomus papatasi TaxID=29031 RepID=UPI002483E61F|nr:uncharacterized protein LOC129802769 [Phlebotomus papatasi]